MRNKTAWFIGAICACAMVLSTGCDDDSTAATDTGVVGGAGGAAGGSGGSAGGAGGAMGGAGGEAPPFGSEADVQMAQALWTEIEGHQDTWPQPAAKHGWVDGAMPHGSSQQFYQNGTDNNADGYIIIKRNYGARDEAMLGALTVMKKMTGYDPDRGDWFYAKFKPDGSLDEAPNGLAMAGQVAGCIGCHTGADGGDFLFSFDAGEVPNGAPFGRPVDQALATNLWAEIADRADWNQPESKQGWQEGSMPHGSWQQFYHNGDDNSADGYVIIKENYGAQDLEMLGAITVMKKMHGYSPDAGDWFFAKYMPDGTPDVNEGGVQLVGKVGLGMGVGCIGCHANAPGGDYLFSFD